MRHALRYGRRHRLICGSEIIMTIVDDLASQSWLIGYVYAVPLSAQSASEELALERLWTAKVLLWQNAKGRYLVLCPSQN